MAPGLRDLQLTRLAGGDEESGDLEDVRLLDSYEDTGSFNRIEEGMRTIQVRITGMTCAACSNSVESALNSVNGVLRASVALLQNRADVVFDPNLVKVCGLGFEYPCCVLTVYLIFGVFECSFVVNWEMGQCFFWWKFEFLELVLLFWTMGPGLVIIAL